MLKHGRTMGFGNYCKRFLDLNWVISFIILSEILRFAQNDVTGSLSLRTERKRSVAIR